MKTRIINEIREKRRDNFLNLFSLLILTPILGYTIALLRDYLNCDKFEFKLTIPIEVVFIITLLTAGTAAAYTAKRDSDDFNILLDQNNYKPELKSPPSNDITFHQQLLEADFSEDEIRSHNKLNFFYDPVSRELTQDPAITNTGVIVDERTAEQLINNDSRLFSNQNISFFAGSPQLKKLLSILIEEAIKEKEINANNYTQ